MPYIPDEHKKYNVLPLSVEHGGEVFCYPDELMDEINQYYTEGINTSYPYNAIEEAVVNAFYHRDYTKYEPVTIEIEPDCIRIINCPGIDRSVSDATIKEGKRFRSRYYRNRRLGEFLHELALCEGHCTGVPTIQEELERNGSPAAVFDTEEDRRSLCVTIPIHPRFLKSDKSETTGIESEKPDTETTETGIETGIEINLTDTEKSIIDVIQRNPAITISDIAKGIGMSRSGAQYAIDSLKKKGVLKREGATKRGRWVISESVKE